MFSSIFYKNLSSLPGVVAHTCDHSTQEAEAKKKKKKEEAEARGLLWVQGQPKVHAKTLSQKQQQKKNLSSKRDSMSQDLI